MRSVAVAAAILLSIASASARDSGQWGDDDLAIGAWFKSLMQPDNPTVSCCGEADAYWADKVGTGPNGETIAIITDDRDDAELHRHHVPVGTRIVVPPNKIKFDRGNPTGHIVIFLSYMNEVYCYVQDGGY